MAVFRYSYPVLLILAGLASGSEVSAKSVCSNDSVKLFSSIQINNSDTTVILYKNSDKQRPIAWWTSINHTIKQENVVMDEYRNIWIINAHPLDEGNYILKYDIRNSNALKFEVKLSILVAPTTTCQPTVKRVDNILKASLERGDCGTPKVSVFWLEYIGVIYEGKDLAKLPPGREAGIYYACIEGPSISCVRSSHLSSDHCFPYKIEENTSQPDYGGSKTQTSTDVSKDELHSMIAVVIGIQIMWPLLLLVAYILYKRYNERSKRKEEGHRDEQAPLQDNATVSGVMDSQL